MPKTLTAEVVGITDGDTFTARIKGKQVKVRLQGIDAPEKGQAFGNASKKSLSSLIYGKVVSLTITDTDRWGRSIAEVGMPDGRRVSVTMVQTGMAWHFVRYAADDAALAAAEASARKKRRGLWMDSSPVPPWDFRQVKH